MYARSPKKERAQYENCVQRQKDIYEQAKDQLLLYQTVIERQRKQIGLEEQRIAKQRAFIRHQKRKLLLQNALLDSEKERFKAMQLGEHAHKDYFYTDEAQCIAIVVGDKRFVVSIATALKDKTSLLAAMAQNEAPLRSALTGNYRFDRDWWLFRYILIFLRDERLPEDPRLLRKLYLECEFWAFNRMRAAIEEKNLRLMRGKEAVPRDKRWWGENTFPWADQSLTRDKENYKVAFKI